MTSQSTNDAGRKKVNAAWLQPVSTDPQFLINRDAELEDLVDRLDEYHQAKIREGHFLITGPRGMGKSIFTKKALSVFASKNHAICIAIDSRGITYRPFLERLAKNLATEVSSRAEQGKRVDLKRWADQLQLLASNQQISKAQAETIATRYGADTKFGADLLYKLEAHFTWEQTRSLGTTVQTSLTVTEELLYSAICTTLHRLTAEPWIVVVFFDDLDQANTGDTETDVATLFRKVLDLGPCISLVHFRTEALIENVGREAGEKIDLKPLSADNLLEILLRRLQGATEVVRKQFPPSTDSSWDPIKRLASLTGNPLVFIQWVHGLLRTQKWPIRDDWNSEKNLGLIVQETPFFTGVDEELLCRLMKVVDQLEPGRILDKNSLIHGAYLGTSPLEYSTEKPTTLTPDEVEHLIRFHALIPKVRFQPEMGFRPQPVLDLLRPSLWKSA